MPGVLGEGRRSALLCVQSNTVQTESACVRDMRVTRLGMFLIPVYTYLILGVLVMPLTCRL